MAQGDFKGLSARHQSEVREFLSDFSTRLIRDGEEMRKSGAIQRMWWAISREVLLSDVVTDDHAQIILTFTPTDLDEVACSLCEDFYCSHVAAVCLAALAEWRGPGRPDVREPAATKVESADPPPKDTPPKGTPPKDTPQKEAASQNTAPADATTDAATTATAPTGTELVRYLTARTGKPLIRRETELVRAIEEFWRTGDGTLTEQRLNELGGHSGYFYGWRHDRIVIWPDHRPPATSIEAFFYIAQALRVQNKLTSLSLYSTVDWEAVEALIAPWQAELEVMRWRKELGRLSLLPRERQELYEFRLRLDADGGTVEWHHSRTGSFEPVKAGALRECLHAISRGKPTLPHPVGELGRRFLEILGTWQQAAPRCLAGTDSFNNLLRRLIQEPGLDGTVVGPDGRALIREPDPLVWALVEPGAPESGVHGIAESPDYTFVLQRSDGAPVPRSLATIKGSPTLYVLPDRIYELHDPLTVPDGQEPFLAIPAGAVESEEGVAALRAMRIPLPERITSRIESVPFVVTVRCRLDRPPGAPHEHFQISAKASIKANRPNEIWNGVNWEKDDSEPAPKRPRRAPDAPVFCADRTQQAAARDWLRLAGMESWGRASDGHRWHSRRLNATALREFPEFFTDWLSRRPDGIIVELDPDLASLRDGTVAGRVRLDVQEAGVDWFDLRVELDVSDVELTPSEIDLLLKASGRWVRLADKGWRRLEFEMTNEEAAHLADMGLAMGDLTKSESQRLHVFQLAGSAGTRLLPPERAVEVKRRAEELRTTVTPEVPAAVTASLRPYQRDGYHFLAYLSANRFGGILADDMGLGKTVQTLTWLAWLRETGQLDGPVLVVCPKSVQDNWRGEIARFCPDFRARVWTPDSAGVLAEESDDKPARKRRGASAATSSSAHEIVIINYTQLRLYETMLTSRKWAAAVLDEAQYIKNPSSQTAQAACGLQASHRLALSGTPIENRLLDLWSILHFAMPGALGTRTAFTRHFNGKDDPLARRRLAARVRPFVLRRTKKEVAQDLPDRIEEEIVCDLEGPQATLYRAELKRARAVLLKAKTASQLDKLRFNILTSLLRLRQICCHPMLAGGGKPTDESAKLTALLELLDPLMEEGHKVLVFSQFVEMLELIRDAVAAREWPHLLLTGKTEDRGALVNQFQNTEGASIFLISLKAGGFGLNLTAASYVVLFDPWWNPAVENQAIDRTHRIGQVNKVMAYRFLARATIEEKIRELQKQKSNLASDILGEESFAKALTLDDFQFLLGDSTAGKGG